MTTLHCIWTPYCFGIKIYTGKLDDVLNLNTNLNEYNFICDTKVVSLYASGLRFNTYSEGLENLSRLSITWPRPRYRSVVQTVIFYFVFSDLASAKRRNTDGHAVPHSPEHRTMFGNFFLRGTEAAASVTIQWARLGRWRTCRVLNACRKRTRRALSESREAERTKKKGGGGKTFVAHVHVCRATHARGHSE